MLFLILTVDNVYMLRYVEFQALSSEYRLEFTCEVSSGFAV